jgi:hypothetical protein
VSPAAKATVAAVNAVAPMRKDCSVRLIAFL